MYNAKITFLTLAVKTHMQGAMDSLLTPALYSHGEEQKAIEGGDQFLTPNGSAIDEGHPDPIPDLQGHGAHHVITIAGVVIISIGNSCSISLVVVES